MSLIKITLLFGALASLIFYLRFLRSALRDRVIAALIFTGLAALILFPDITVSIAHLLGVGRGTDLVFYLFAIGATFLFILLYSKIENTNLRITELVRSVAILSAHKPDE